MNREDVIWNFLCFFNFWHFAAPWWPNAKTKIPEIVHTNRFRGPLQVCNSLCKSIMNREDVIWNFLFFQFFDILWPPGGLMQKPKSLKFCTLIDFVVLHKFAIHYVSEFWTGKKLFGIVFVFFNFWHFAAPWWPNAKTKIPEILHTNRSRGPLQVCNSLCK